MAITQETKLYEILLRYNRDGLQGSHAIDCEYLMDGETILRQTEQPARPVTQIELATLVDAQTASLMAQVTAMTATAALHETAMTEKDAAVTAAETALATKQAEIDALQAQLNPVDEAGFAVLTPIQIRLALLGAGVNSATIDAVIAAIPDAAQRETASFYWEYSREYHRDHPLITQFAAALGLTDEQINALWAQAATL